ncbi:hypothetical protein CTEN210_11288 [Chaetoceros tenuissimus]|uniref:G-protein coupled receptors family 1 profile domain-containing protein n=1 Tax=Chaetoceros tenuissimus TaxID=426638 RepID=A0AAD3H8S2_9STRA|nr:hypothetical protein CTEN210_11288 [Chaetoceros tenuissimus]
MIISSVYRSFNNRRSMQQIILALMSIADFTLAFCRLTGFLWVPPHEAATAGYFGNQTSCIIQGFILEVAFSASVGYNLALALYYLLVVKHSWKPKRLDTIKYWLYVLPVCNGFVWAILGVSLNLIHGPQGKYVEDICYVHQDRYADEKDKKTFNNATIVWVCFATMYFVAIVCNIVCIIIVYRHVKRTERSSRRYSINVNNATSRTKLVATQFKLFAAVFLAPGILFVGSSMLYHLGVPVPRWYETIGFTFAFSAGFLNALVYFRVRFKKLRSSNPNSSKLSIVMDIICDTLFPCCIRKEQNKDNIGDCELQVSDATDETDKEDGTGHKRFSFVQRLSSIVRRRSSSFFDDRHVASFKGELKDSNFDTPSRRQSTTSLRGKSSYVSHTSTQSNDWRALKAAGVKTIQSEEDKHHETNHMSSVCRHTEQVCSPSESLRSESEGKQDWRALKASGVKTISSENHISTDEKINDSLIEKEGKSSSIGHHESNALKSRRVSFKEDFKYSNFDTPSRQSKTSLRSKSSCVSHSSTQSSDWRALKAAGVNTIKNDFEENTAK